MQETSEISVALEWATEIFGFINVPKYFIAPQNFLAAYREGDSFSFTLSGDPIYGQAYGPNPYLDPRWGRVSVSSSHPAQLFDPHPGMGFEIWAIQTSASGAPLEIITDYKLINSILDADAPDSSVRPGGDEEIFWGAIRNESGEIASLGVLTRWQSGEHILASVVTRAQDRGKGLATKLAAGVSTHAFSLGIPEVGLGVRADNYGAQRAYEKAGYQLVAAFTNYSQA
jgi:ribosomal protein S18 acetylase RimI-like enzyme